MIKVSGVSGAGPSWYEIMTYMHQHEPSHAPAVPAGIVSKNIRHKWTSNEHPEFFIAGTEPAQTVIEPAPEKRVQFVFPAEGSVLVKNPQIDQDHVALYIRFQGQVPEHSQLMRDGKLLGEAKSPFKLQDLPDGDHSLTIVSQGAVLGRVHFTIR
jgi:penicillin-binding protein 1C